MATTGLVIFFIAWFWSVIRGVQVSLLCVALNFFFPPVSQAIFAYYEDEMRYPFIALGIGLMLMFIGGR